jgi:excisionase family DNA binding protein
MSRNDQSVDEDGPTQVFARAARPTAPIPAPAPDRGGLWDSNDVARYLKVSRSWVYHRAEAGLLPCVRIGSLLRFDPKVIARLAESGK